MSALTRSKAALTILVMALTLLAGCSTYEPLSLHGAGSMRVEVEVYKGPVGQSAEAQIGQTAAVLGEAIRALDSWHYEAVALMGPGRCWTAGKNPGDAQLWGACPAPGEAGPPPIPEPEQVLLQRKLCEKADGNAQYTLSMDQWRDCTALRTAINSSEAAIAAACYMINTPAFGVLRDGVYLPIETCRIYGKKWNYLTEFHYGTLVPKDDLAVTGTFLPPTILELQKRFNDCAGLTQAHVNDLKNASDTSRLALAPAKPQGTAPTQAELDAKARFEADWRAYSEAARTQATAALVCYQEAIVIAIQSYATILRSSAFRDANANIRYVPRDRDIRGMLASYAYVASEYGNQLSSRIDTLQKLLKDGANAKMLPTSDYLRGASNTDFVHLYDWLEGAEKHYPLGSPGKLNVAERIRMAERLNADYYWEKVNEVYASGQGDVSMAFVKDALGNWDLKSFSNDPSDLLKSYRKVTDAALTTAAKLATKAATGAPGVAADRLLSAQRAADFANRLAGGEAAPTTGSDVKAMHDRVVTRIEARRARFLELEKPLAARRAELSALIKPFDDKIAAGKITNAQDIAADRAATVDINALEESKAPLATEAAQIDAKLAVITKDAITSIRDLLDDHLAAVAATQAGIAGEETEVAKP
ncbi:MAG: hypothetical protein JWR77_1519 [Rhizorhabdus sp.]|nr:hypothetical protein [Rhizorhabdus sp.]